MGIVLFLLSFMDASRIYHSIRGQSAIKLYVIFNVLEVFDKLCCSFGLDLLESFFASPTSNVKEDPEAHHTPHLHPILHFILSVVYLCMLLLLDFVLKAYSLALDGPLLPGNYLECVHQ